MKKLFAAVLFLLSAQSFAQNFTCLNKLLPVNRYSGLHLITRDEFTLNRGVLDTETAKAAINYLVRTKLLCNLNEITIKVDPVCSQITADLVQSKTCFAFTNLGYFVISADSAKNVSFIFGRDKQFSK